MKTRINLGKFGLSNYAEICTRDKDGNTYTIPGCEGRLYNRILDAGLDSCGTNDFFMHQRTVSVGSDNTATTDGMTKLVSYSHVESTYDASSRKISSNAGNTITGSAGWFRMQITREVFLNSSGVDIPVGELGFGLDNSSDPDLFSRIALPSVIQVADGLSFIVTYTFTVNLPPAYNTLVPTTLTTDGNVEDGDLQFYSDRPYSQFPQYTSDLYYTGIEQYFGKFYDENGVDTQGDYYGIIVPDGGRSQGSGDEQEFVVHDLESSGAPAIGSFKPTDSVSYTSSSDAYIDGTKSVTVRYVLPDDVESLTWIKSFGIRVIYSPEPMSKTDPYYYFTFDDSVQKPPNEEYEFALTYTFDRA